MFNPLSTKIKNLREGFEPPLGGYSSRSETSEPPVMTATLTEEADACSRSLLVIERIAHVPQAPIHLSRFGLFTPHSSRSLQISQANLIPILVLVPSLAPAQPRPPSRVPPPSSLNAPRAHRLAAPRPALCPRLLGTTKTPRRGPASPSYFSTRRLHILRAVAVLAACACAGNFFWQFRHQHHSSSNSKNSEGSSESSKSRSDSTFGSNIVATTTAVATATSSSAIPFVLLFESGSGSSWLASSLATHPRVCLVLFEPIDNSSLTSAADHAARLRWLEILWSPPHASDAEDAWSDWRRRLIAASTFGQLPLIRRSLGRCTAASRSFGLKARLSRLLTHEGAMRGLRELLARKRVRLIRLERRNRIKQALAEYRRLHAGLGHFTSRSTSAGSRQVDVDLRLFRKSVAAVERSHRLASKVLTYLQPAQPLLTLSYESLLTEHDASVRRVEDFLALASPAAAAANPHAAAANAEAERVSPDDGAAPVEGAPQAYHKATPDRLCAAVRNYAALCREWWHGQYAEFFDEPCEAACGPGRLHL